MPKQKRRAPRGRKLLDRAAILRAVSRQPEGPKDDTAWRAFLEDASRDLRMDDTVRRLNDLMRAESRLRGAAAVAHLAALRPADPSPPPALSTSSPAPVRRPRRKITKEIWDEHLRLHPLGRKLGAHRRAHFLKTEQDIHVDRSTVTRWLQRSRA